MIRVILYLAIYITMVGVPIWGQSIPISNSIGFEAFIAQDGVLRETIIRP